MGHIENACPEKVRNDESSKGGAQGNEPFKGGKGDEPPKGIIKEVKFKGSLDFSGSDFDQQVINLPIEQVNTSKGSCTVLWDSGSMLNLISTEWADKVGLVGKKCNLHYKVVDNYVRSISSRMYDLHLISKDGNTKTVRVYGIDDLAAKGRALSSQSLSDLVKSLDESVKESDIGNCNLKVDLLLGSSCIADFPIVKFKLKDLCLMSSEFGITNIPKQLICRFGERNSQTKWILPDKLSVRFFFSSSSSSKCLPQAQFCLQKNLEAPRQMKKKIVWALNSTSVC